MLCAPIAFHYRKRRWLFQLNCFVIFAETVVSSYGFLRRERREDWRGVTEYLVKLPERPRLVVVVTDFCQTLVRYYSSDLFKSYPPIEVTGLQTKFDPPDPGFELPCSRSISRLIP